MAKAQEIIDNIKKLNELLERNENDKNNDDYKEGLKNLEKIFKNEINELTDEDANLIFEYLFEEKVVGEKITTTLYDILTDEEDQTKFWEKVGRFSDNIGEKESDKKLLPNQFYMIKPNIYEDDVPVLKVDGTKMVIHQKGLNNIFVCNGNKDFIKTLRLLESKEIPKNLDLVIIRAFDRPNNIKEEDLATLPHHQVIKLERRNGKNNFIISDSIGEDIITMGNEEKKTLLLIGMTTQILQQECPRSNIYYMPEKRQADEFSCRVYSVKDAFRMTKINLLKKLHIEKRKDENGFYRCTMPEDMYIYAQSRAEIAKYAKKCGKGLSSDFYDKIYKQRDYGKTHTPYKKRKEDNTEYNVPSYIYYLAAKYGGLIDEVVKGKSAEEIQNILDEKDGAKLTVEKIKDIAKSQNHVKQKKPSRIAKAISFAQQVFHNTKSR